MKKKTKPKGRYTLDQALVLLDEAYGFIPDENREHLYTKKTLHNYLSQGKLKRYGPSRVTMVDGEEILEVLGPSNSERTA